MFLLAWRQLSLDWWRTSTTALVVGAVVAVIARSSIPQLARREIEALAGVRAVHPMTTVPMVYEKDGRRTPIMVFVADTRGGARTIVDGRDVMAARDIVVDQALAAAHDIHVGDPFIVSDFEFTVAGIAKGSAAFFVPFAFIGYDGMPAVDVLTPDQMAARSVALGRSFLAPIMDLLVTAGYVTALLVVAMILYVEVATRLRSFAVLRALGFPSRRISRTVLRPSPQSARHSR